MDLYPLPGKPRIFDLRVACAAGRPIGTSWPCSTGSSVQTASIRLDPQDLGWAAGQYVFYDAWGKKLLGGGRATV